MDQAQARRVHGNEQCGMSLGRLSRLWNFYEKLRDQVLEFDPAIPQTPGFANKGGFAYRPRTDDDGDLAHPSQRPHRPDGETPHDLALSSGVAVTTVWRQPVPSVERHGLCVVAGRQHTTRSPSRCAVSFADA